MRANMSNGGTNMAKAIAPAQEPRMAEDLDAALRARDDIEQVAIEAVHVGDHIIVDPRARAIGACCVITKRAKANERTGRIVGWLVQLNGQGLAWWSRGAKVWRRRIDDAAAVR